MGSLSDLSSFICFPLFSMIDRSISLESEFAEVFLDDFGEICSLVLRYRVLRLESIRIRNCDP